MSKFIAILLLSFTVVFNQGVAADLSFKRLSVEEGLSQSWVIAIAQDSLGFIWFGTSNGLNKYDGYNFRVYTHNPNNKNSLISSHIQAIECDGEGNLWIGTNSGLCFYNYFKDRFEQYDGFTNSSVLSILISDDYLYVGTTNGVFIYNRAAQTLNADLTNSINKIVGNIRVNVVKADMQHKIWLGTTEGLFLLDPQTNLLYKVSNLYSGRDIHISALEIDKANRVWLGTEGVGLILIPDANEPVAEQQLRHFTYNKADDNSISLGKILSICPDKNNQLWVGIENGGISILNLNLLDKNRVSFKRNVKNTGNNKSLSSNSVYSIYNDHRGDIWIGTYGGGVNFYDNDGLNFHNLNQIHNEPNSLINNIVNVITQYNNELWIGTEGGVSVIDLNTKKYRHYIHNPENINSLSTNAVWGIYKQNEKVWFGLWAGGLSELNLSTNHFTHYHHSETDTNTLGSDNVFSLAPDNDNNLWIATMSGGLSYMPMSDSKIHRFQLTSERNYNTLINELRLVLHNSKNELWFSVSSGVGCLNLNTEKTSVFLTSNTDTTSLNGNGAYTIFEDSKGTMWFGTDRGLNYFVRSDSSFKSYIFYDGISNNSIKSILEDKHGNLWMGTNRGILVFYDAISLPQTPSYKIYDASDGLQGNEFNRRSALKNANGDMYFGGTNGVTFFNPENIKENRTLPKIVFTDFLIYNKPVNIDDSHSPLKSNISLTKHITLNASQSVFTLQFAGLNFISTEKTQYAYKLEGFENEWNYVTHKRTATYTNLNAGEYIFKVKAANNDGYWNNKPTQLYITILPPWYKTTWAFVIYIVLLLTSLYIFIRLSLGRLKEREALRLERRLREQENDLNHQRLQFFTNISHEFRTPLTLIISPIEDIIRNKFHQLPDDIKNRMATIYKNANRLTRLATELMDFRKLQFNKLKMNISQQDICAFTKNVTQLFREEALLQNINLTINIPEKPLFLWFDPSMIEKVLFNLISNAFKFTPENQNIEVKVAKVNPYNFPGFDQNADYVSIQVKDTGMGLSENKLDKIFERFYQSDNHKNTYYSSTGIGLSLAKSLMEMHLGDITVESTLNKGSVFTVWLRQGNKHFSKEQLSKAPKQIIEPELNPLPLFNPIKNNGLTNKRDLTMLIVEDNKELRKYLVENLESEFKTLEASNGKQGIEMAEQYMPDIIISDVVMPEIDGLAMCQSIKTNERISHIPIILVTARATIEDQIEGANSGADAYIVKPFHPELLKSKINQLISARKNIFSKFSTELSVLPEMAGYTNIDKDFMKQVADYILDNIGNPELSVEELGTSMNLSRSQLYRKIKSLSGYSATEFIRVIKLEQARKLILQKNTSINEVGYSVGFSTPSYFTKCYKEHFGKLPSDE